MMISPLAALGAAPITPVQLAVAVKAQELARQQQEQLMTLLEAATETRPTPVTPNCGACVDVKA
ncbi:MAG: hypothetical protein LC135_04615 [Phycisphaerae bacterium]|nr:hypothetical protein [Phycisphaerae bacterium]MCZ2399137.1 hypothetical protein [Phycisphaerae bacterium]NUQ50065.1 hypothetical protein [Phycisphaerae bacterium]